MSSSGRTRQLAAVTIAVPYVYAWLRGYHSLEMFLLIGSVRLIAALFASAAMCAVVYLVLRIRRRDVNFQRAFWIVTLMLVSLWALISSSTPPFSPYV